MQYGSFYGGKQGRSYKLVHHFDSIYDMVLAFQGGGSYTTVGYGEYVIIDTIFNNSQYNNPENGIIYRRGLDYLEPFFTSTDDVHIDANHTVAKEDRIDDDESKNKIYYDYETATSSAGADEPIVTFNEDRFRAAFQAFVLNPGGGAEYVGQIVGPEGDTPQLSLLDWDSFLAKYEAGSDTNRGVFNINPIPGYDEQTDTYNDVQKYGYLDIRDAYGRITGAYISLDIPYTLIKMHSESISPYPELTSQEKTDGVVKTEGNLTSAAAYAVYDETTNQWSYTSLITEDDKSAGHPYFYQYDIKVPKGIHGHDIKDFNLHKTGATLEVTTEEGNIQTIVDQSNNNYQFYNLVTNYDLTEQGETTRNWLQSWERSIFSITNNGIMPNYPEIARDTEYEMGDNVRVDGLGDHLYLTAVTGGRTSGIFDDNKTITSDGYTITNPNYNPTPQYELFEQGRTFEDGTVTWQVIKDTTVPPSLLRIHYTHGDDDQVKIRLLDNLLFNKENGRIYAKYTDLDTLTYLGENQSIYSISYVDSVDNEGTKVYLNQLKITYNTFNYDEDTDEVSVDTRFYFSDDGTILRYPITDEEGRKVYFVPTSFKFLDHLEIDDITRMIVAYYNDGTSVELGQNRSILKMYISNDGDVSKSKYLTAQYNSKINNGTTYDIEQVSTNPINEIASIQTYGDNIIILYSDPDVRKSLYDSTKDYKLPLDAYELRNYTATSGDEGNYLYWINYGALYNSNHIYGNFDSLASLQAQFPYGFDKDTSGNLLSQNANFAGWVATVKDSDGNTVLYVYDYLNNSGWYSIQNTADSISSPEKILIIDSPSESDENIPNTSSLNTGLAIGGYWGAVYNRTETEVGDFYNFDLK